MTAVAAPSLDDLLHHFLALTEVAERACANEDATALAGALDARELASARLIAFGRTLGPRLPLSAATRRLMDSAVTANSLLEVQVASARDEIRRQLERTAHDEVAVAGYAGAAPRTARVDVRR
jgi:hypothetical protein